MLLFCFVCIWNVSLRGDRAIFYFFFFFFLRFFPGVMIRLEPRPKVFWSVKGMRGRGLSSPPSGFSSESSGSSSTSINPIGKKPRSPTSSRMFE